VAGVLFFLEVTSMLLLRRLRLSLLSFAAAAQHVFKLQTVLRQSVAAIG
jgi:hypothetical protein